jgi:hypothetical protein
VQAAAPSLGAADIVRLSTFLRDRAHNRGSSAKARRTELRKHFAGIIGVNIGQQLRSRIDIRSLDQPLLLAGRRAPMPSLDATGETEFGIGDMFDSAAGPNY